MNTAFRPLNQQSGVVLVISLIILVLLGLIGVSASQNSGMEERMAGNSRDKNLAFQAAETTLVAAEQFLVARRADSTMPTFSSTGTDGYYQIAPTGNILGDEFWSGPNVQTYTVTLYGIDTDDHPPKYIIQDLGCVAPCPATPPANYPHNFRITAYARGGTTSAVAILQSIYRI